MTDFTPEGIFKVRLPLPFRLNHVNCYALKGRDGWTVIDAGLNYEPTRLAWERFMREHGFIPQDITGIYVTHHHPDHYGAAGWLQELSGAPVYMNPVESALAARMWREDLAGWMSAMFLENGLPGDLMPNLLEEVALMQSRTRPHPRVTLLDGTKTVRLGDRDYRIVVTPGHADGHTCFYDEETGLLLSGDHLLPQISSNISRWPHSRPDPLEDFLTSLAENKQLRAKAALPGHGLPFTGIDLRLTQLEEHHRERLELMRGIAARGATAYQVARAVFGDELSLHETRFAVTETMAHLNYLEIRGRLKVDRRDGRLVYSGP
ncbi:MAG: MBL fold metallo-hydrolase [Peptococcaceae bacterium]|jgi:glyoxylase-like metal-dependent hydrolase (beta-lactamase superfamily II)|nr:MBL fold metallo-hydrolase [Peptococcaceae bacterium]